MPEYVSPGAAASDAISGFLAEQEARKRQAMLDQITQQKAADTHNEAMAALQEKKTEALAKIEDKEKANTIADVHGMVMGDIPDPDLIARARKYHIPLKTVTSPADVPATPPPAPGIIQSMGGPTPAVPPPSPLPIRFGGTPVEQGVAKQKSEQDAYIASLPEGPLKEAALYKAKTGENAPAAALKPAGVVNDAPVMTREQALAAGRVPSNAKIIEPLQPKDTSAADARKDTHRDQVYNTAVTEIAKSAKPYEDQLMALDNLGVSLSTDSQKADALIAPELLKATIAGGGVRITQPEINSVLSGSRSTWDSLQLKLNKIAGGDQSMVLLPEEKKAIRELAKKLRTKAHDQVVKITRARHKLDDLDDPRDIQKAATSLQDELNAPSPEDTAATKPVSTETADELYKRLFKK